MAELLATRALPTYNAIRMASTRIAWQGATVGVAERPRLLVIPHSAERTLKLRGFELARHLSRKFEVLYLDCDVSGLDPRFKRFEAGLREVWRTSRLAEAGGVKLLRVSHLHKPRRLARSFNERILAQVISSLGIKYVLNQSFWLFPTPRIAGVFHIYDVVDNTLASSSPARLRSLARQHVARHVAAADLVTASSRGLVSYIRREFGHEGAVFVANGADVELYRKAYAAEHDVFRRDHALEGKKIVGFIGNHGAWSGLDFLLDAFDLLRRRRGDIALLVVGPISSSQPRGAELKETGGRDIVFLGAQPPGLMPFFFTLSDVGVLPFERSPFTDDVLPLKVIEYGAARKPVVATPLSELQRLKLPNVLLAERDSTVWAKRLEEALELEWRIDWDSTFDRFRWDGIVDYLVRTIQNSEAGRSLEPS